MQNVSSTPGFFWKGFGSIVIRILQEPVDEKVAAARNKYLSASKVYAASLENLQKDLHGQDVCMIFLLIDVPRDRLMAYQHTKRLMVPRIFSRFRNGMFSDSK